MATNDIASLIDLFRYNQWANERVFDVCGKLDPAMLAEVAPGANESIENTLSHLMGVEDAYLAMIRGQPLGSFGSREEYFAHSLPWFAERVKLVGAAYLDLLDGPSPLQLDQPLSVPWINAPLTARDGLLQVLTHSGQHRAQVFSVLGARGIEVPGLDYVQMLEETKGSRAS